MFANTVRKSFLISKNSVTELYARSTYNFVRLFFYHTLKLHRFSISQYFFNKIFN